MKFGCTLFLLASMSMSFYGQSNELKKLAERNRLIKKSTKIDPTKPAVYIDFVKIGEAEPEYSDESKEGVYLKLVNNSKWSIYVPKFVYGNNAEKIGVYYEVKREGIEDFTDEEIPKGMRRGHCCSGNVELKSGKSVSFNIPRNHLAENLMIRIYFDFEWELDFDGPIQTQILYPKTESSVFFTSSGLKKFQKEKK